MAPRGNADANEDESDESAKFNCLSLLHTRNTVGAAQSEKCGVRCYCFSRFVSTFRSVPFLYVCTTQRAGGIRRKRKRIPFVYLSLTCYATIGIGEGRIERAKTSLMGSGRRRRSHLADMMGRPLSLCVFRKTKEKRFFPLRPPPPSYFSPSLDG